MNRRSHISPSDEGGRSAPTAAGDGLGRAAFASREALDHPPDDDASALVEAWCRSLAGPADPARVFRDLHLSDPQAAGHLALGLAMLPEVGDEFLGFRLIDELGRGAFGRVFLARQGDLADRPVALKVSPELSGEPRVLARLQHTNIVPVYSVHRAGPLQVVCMPYYGSTTLRDVYEGLEDQEALPVSGRGLLSTLNERKGSSRPGEGPSRSGGRGAGGGAPGPELPAGAADPTPPAPYVDTLRYLESLTYVQAVLWVAARLAGGLAHAHERGILHRDLKPANILLTDEGQPMLLDFNLAEDLGARSGATAAVGGTLHYMAPEHLDAFRGGPRPVDARSDLYSLGVIFYELLTGRRPFSAPDGPYEEMIDRMIRDRLGPPPGVRRWNQAVTPATESIVLRCLEPDPAHRYRTALELQEDLERQLSDRPLKYAPEPSLHERLTKWVRRHPVLCSSTTIATLAVALAGLVGALGWCVVAEHRDATAQFQHVVFRKAFEECQLLLNTRSDSSDHLTRGIRLARGALAEYGVDGPGDWTTSDRLGYLPAPERHALREELSELVQLEARACIALARRGGSAAELEGALRRGVARLDAAERFDPRPPAALYYDRGQYHLALGEPERAARDRQREAQVPIVTARDHDLLGTALLARGDVDAAERALGRAVALDPRRFWSWFTLGICHGDQGRLEDAALDFSICTTLAPDQAWAHLNRGLALARAGRLPEARMAYDRSLELDPELVEALVDRALTALELDDPAQARSDLERAIALGQRTPPVLTARAAALARLGLRTEAEQAFAEVIPAHPSDPMPLVARGFARLDGDRPGAEADFVRALELDPHNARAHLGRAYLLRGSDSRGALALLAQALAADPELDDAVQLRGLIRARQGDRSAEADVERLLRTPTPQKLYNAACCLALLARSEADPRLVSRAIDLLRRALDSGLDAGQLADDPDLDALRGSPRFAALVAPRLATAR